MRVTLGLIFAPMHLGTSPPRAPVRTCRGARRFVPVVVVLTLLAAACGDDGSADTSSSTTTSATSTTTVSTTSVAPATTTEAPPPPPDDSCTVIGDDGLPVVAAGADDTAILAVLGPEWSAVRDAAYLVDVDGYRFVCNDETVFYGAWALGEPEGVSLVISDHPDFVDAAGVGPEMSVADAIARHGGSAIVTVNTEFESREFIEFADGGTPGWLYRVGSPSTGFAGVYPEPVSGYVETSTFVDDAVITQVWWEPGVFDDTSGTTGEAVLSPADLGYPEVGTIVDLQVGDISCYATVIGPDGLDVSVGATFEICARVDLLDTTSALTYRLERVSDCESAEPCDASREEWLLTDAEPLAAPEPRVIEFSTGESGATLSGAVIRGERFAYSVEASAGQTLTASITALEDNAVFDLAAPSGVSLVAEATEVDVVLSEDGDHVLVVGGTRGNATYELTISIT